MNNCPLSLGVGCQYGVSLVCPIEHEDCQFYQLNERQRLLNEMTAIQIRAGELETSFLTLELDLWRNIRER